VKILVIDDSEASRVSLRFHLTMKKYKVIDVADSSEALNCLITDNDIGLVITDINMPGIDGIELIHRIRNKLNLSVPIIALTTDEEKGKQAISKGASASVMKSSIASEEILRFVTYYLK
jgi:CheY-like chemotaxis protein